MAVTSRSAGLKPELSAALSNVVVNVVSRFGVYRPISDKEVQALISLERQKQLLGCAEEDSSCLAELGGALGAEKLLTTEVTKVGTRFQVNLTLFQTATGSVAARETAYAEDSEDALLETVEAAAHALMSKLRQPNDPPPPELVARKGPSKALSYAGIAVGGTMMLAGTVGLLRSNQLADELRDGPDAITNEEEFQQAFGPAKTLNTLGFVGVGVGTAILATSIVSLFVGGPQSASVAVVPQDGGLAVGLTVRLR